MTEDEMVGWHRQLNGYEFEQALGDSGGQISLVCCSLWGHKELDKTERLSKDNDSEELWQEPAGGRGLRKASPAVRPLPAASLGWAPSALFTHSHRVLECHVSARTVLQPRGAQRGRRCPCPHPHLLRGGGPSVKCKSLVGPQGTASPSLGRPQARPGSPSYGWCCDP